MSHEPEEFSHDRGGDTVSTRVMELVVAGALMIVAAVVMDNTWRIGAGWARRAGGRLFPVLYRPDHVRLERDHVPA